jgi:hypothetical protein
METVTVTLGGKKYRATGLTLGEFGEIARIDAAIREAGKESNVPKAYALFREAVEIICIPIRRAGSDVPTEEAKKAWLLDDVVKAIVALLNFIEGSSFEVEDESTGRLKIQ